MDHDGSGAIEMGELKSVMSSMGFDGNTDEILQSVDIDRSGKIEFGEFVLIMAKRILETDGQAELELAFKLLDRDGNGYILADEASKLLTTTGQPFTEAEMRLFMSMVDVSSDGRISKDEFRGMECWKLPEVVAAPSAA